MVSLQKNNFLIRVALIGCILWGLLINVDLKPAYGASKTYIIHSNDDSYSYHNRDYYLYVPTSLAPGTFICKHSPSQINTANSLKVLPYKVWVKYQYHLDTVESNAYSTLAISRCASDGTVISGSTTVKQIGASQTITDCLAVGPNEALLFDFNTGKYHYKHHHSWHYKTCRGYVKITVLTDEAAPDTPQTPEVKAGNGNIVEVGSKTYTNNDEVILAWNQVADNKTTIDGHEIGTDTASAYTLNINGVDTEWTDETQLKLSDVNSNSEGTYQIKLKARDYEGNESAYSEPITLVIDRSVTQPMLPTTSFKIETNSESKYNVTFNWKAVTDRSEFKYQVALSKSTTAPADYEIKDVTANQYTFSGISASSDTYYAYVRVIDAAGNISPWTKSSALVLTSPTAKITAIAASSKLQNGQPSYAVNLTLENVGADTYVIERQLDGASTRTAVATLTKAQMAANSFKYIDASNMVKHGKYTYYVHTQSSLGSTSSETSKTVTIPNIPAAVTITASSGTQLSGQIIINSSSYSFGITPKQDSEGDQIKFRVKYYPTGNSSQAKYSSDSKSLQSGTVTVPLTEGSWSCQLEAGEFVDGVELADSSYTRQTSAVVKVVVDLTPPPAEGNAFVIQSTDGATTYDTAANPTKTPTVAISGLTLVDNPSGSGISGIYLWNGDSSTRPAGAVYKSMSETATHIAWTLPDGDGIKTVTMQVLDKAGNTRLVTYQVKLDTTAPAIPGSFTHIPSGNQIHFQWQADNPNGDLVKFQGQYTLADGTVKDFETDATTTDNMASGKLDIDTSGLTANSQIKLKVLAVDQAGNASVYSEPYTVYTRAKLGTLTDLTSGYDLNLGQYVFKWQLDPASGAAAGYQLEYGNVTASGFTALGTLHSDANGVITHTGLTPHGTYHYRLIALNGSNDRTEGTAFDRQVPNTAPSAPILQSPLAFGRNGSEFKYAGASDVDGDTLTYHLYLQESGGSVSELNSTTASGLVEGQTYLWYVVAEDGYGGKTQSASGQFAIDNTAPNLTVESVRRTYTNQVQLTVTAGDSGSGIAKVDFQKMAADTNQVTESGTITLTSNTDGHLTGTLPLAEGNYHLQITAYDHAGNSTLVPVNNVKNDQTAPELTQAQLDLEPVDGNDYSTGTLPVKLSASDSFSGVATLRYWILGQSDAELGAGQTIRLSSSVHQYSQKIPLSGVSGKTYDLKLAVEDAAGNRSQVSSFGPVTLDLTAPEATLSLDGLKNYGTGYYLTDLQKLTVNCQATDPESGIKTVQYVVGEATSAQFISEWGSWDTVKETPLTAGKSYYIAVKVRNKAGLETQQQSVSFIYDNTAPQDLKLTGPKAASVIPGEQVTFTATATEAESPLSEYRLALGTDPSGSTEWSSLITGNSEGWLVKKSGGTSVQFRLQAPVAIANGTYYPIIKVTNAAGLVSSYVGAAVSVDNTGENLSVSDQGPYTPCGDRLTGWWAYLGGKTVTGYQYRIVDQDSQTVRDWTETSATEATVSGLSLADGKQYFIEVKASFTDGSTLTATSPGVTVDSTNPQNVSLTTPDYTTSANLNFKWQATDDESGIDRVWAALGSDYYQTDVSGGWIEVSGQNAWLTRDTKGKPLTLKNGGHYYLTLRVSNGVGLITEKANPGIIIDDTAPPTPAVADQGAYINPAAQPLMASWVWTKTDAESGLASYQWALIPYGGTADNAQWTDAGAGTSLAITRTNLTDGATYYFAVKATNRAGLSSIGYSDGIMMDQTAPVIPTVTLLQSVNLSDPQAATYVTSAENLELAIETYDLTGISSYQYTYDTQDQVTENTDYSSSTQSQFAVTPALNEGEITVFKSICSDGATNISQAGYSTGVILDTGAPQITHVKGAVSGNNLIFDWDAVASGAPVAFYEYALVPEAQVNDTPKKWSKTGLQQSIVIDGTNLTDGHYRLLVRGCSAAGVYSRREGSIDEWGVSPKVTLDRQPPVMDESKFSYPSYAADQMQVIATASDELAGIGGYQYALGSKSDPQQYSDGWVDVDTETGTMELTVPTKAIPHNSEVYLMVRAQDKVGLWSTALVSKKIGVDHTLPTTPVVTCGGYTPSLTQISGITYQSSDPESQITHCRLGLVQETGGEWLMTQETQATDFSGILSGLTLEEGQTYYIAVQTRNGAGEWSPVGYSQAVIADTTPPEVTFTQAESTIVLNAPPLAIEYSLTESADLQFILTGADGSTQQTTASGQAGLNYYNFTASPNQTYQLSAVPTDLAGNIGLVKTQAIRVNAPPQMILPSFKTTPGAALKLAAAVTDPDGIVVSYQWDPGDGSAALTEAEPTHKYNQTGTYTVTLTVTDNDGEVSSATAQVTVGNTTDGPLQGDETWSGTHHLYNQVTVPAGIKLTIAPGTVVIADSPTDADSGYMLTIDGILMIQGTGGEVVFKSTSGEAGGWQGIHITGSAVLEGVTIREGVRGISTADGANVSLKNCIFQHNQVGLHVYQTRPSVTGCSFINNSLYGIKEDEGGRPVLTDCVFKGNGMDYYHETLTDISIDELNALEGNSGNR